LCAAAAQENHGEQVSNYNSKINKLELELLNFKNKAKESNEESAETVCLVIGNTDITRFQKAINQAIAKGYKLQHFAVCYNSGSDKMGHRAILMKE
jgi:oligoribonuclease NrnB/cAMP/cGMP phosphodiesterase (DHH superfamily)